MVCKWNKETTWRGNRSLRDRYSVKAMNPKVHLWTLASGFVWPPPKQQGNYHQRLRKFWDHRGCHPRIAWWRPVCRLGLGKCNFCVKLTGPFCSYCFKLETVIIYHIVLLNQIIAYANVLSLFLCPTFQSSRSFDSKFRQTIP